MELDEVGIYCCEQPCFDCGIATDEGQPIPGNCTACLNGCECLEPVNV